MPKETCDVTCIHQDTVDNVQSKIDQHFQPNASEIFKVLADQTRLKIAFALTIEDELCVCDVANIIGGSSATASHHLRHLRKLGLAEQQKKGKLVYYSLADPTVKQMVTMAFQLNEGRGAHV
ncbi:ArsR/SmtB family transcription factor [Halobacillus campisalis]|uniref:ArsR/SmtB family transcription factor n=1 Tax=Halobacillus campisalis TaxID=435909 RepID=A0ABW2K7H6_9BACI|nr:metalloregulator ArsR/SmtB family transcription factor [Halobacillus campisalis]